MGKEKDKKPLFGGIFQKFFKPSAKAEAKKKKEHHLTVQRSIPYLEMGRDGICRVEEHLYSKTVRFYDINYQLAQNEDKNTIFESWCDFLNYFDSSIRFQLSFINHKSDMSEYNKVIQIEPQHDQFDDVRMEYAQMLKQQLAKGNNGLVRTKYITFSIEAKSVKEAKPRLERIETDILNNFKVLGVKAYDPYQLISHLTAVYEQFTRGQVKPVIKSLFEQQYLLKVWETIEIRTRMETRVGIRPTIDAFGNVSMETYTYQEEVEYEYKILNVLLKNKGFDTIARKNMDRKQTGRYDAYNLTYGNRPELFGAGSPTYSGGTTGSIGSGGSGGTGGSSGGGFRYDIPEEALSDEKFAKMIAEAEKYLGMPYVWGGSSPSTSFDCSGFVCWVINNCGNGWNVGRTTANGLRGKCSYVSPANAQPGDLIFFEKTYNTVGASHVGIYVGNGMMIHCGDPISYTSINSTYWQNHFLGFGRIK